VNVLLLCVGDQLIARKDRVALDLVDGRNETSLINQFFESAVGEVRNTDRSDFALGQLVHSLPCFRIGDRVIDVDLVLSSFGEKVRVGVFARAEVDRPVDEVKVEVIKLKLSKGIVESGLDGGGVMLRVPKLGCDENVLTLKAGDFRKSTL